MTIRIELQPQVYQDTLDNMLFGSTADVGTFKGVPRGGFTHLEGPVTQYTVFGTPFRITTDSVGVKHTIRATLISLDNNLTVASRNRITEQVVVPVNETFTVLLPLRKGESQIDVFTENDGTFTSVIASHVGTFIASYAREIFSSTQNPLNEQARALFSQFSARMTDILIPFQDLYADPKSLRTLISRFITRTYMTKNGSTQGVRDFGAALLGTTPIFVPTKTDEGIFEPNIIPLFRRQLEFAGFEAHSWIPNYEIIHWLSFIKLLDAARNYYTIQEIGESEVLITAGGIPEIHRFNFDNPEASVYSEFNFTNFRVIVEILDKLFIKFSAAGYPFDLFVTANNPLGQRRLTFDSLIPWDSGEPLDQPALDPGADGWVGFPLAGRFDGFALNSDPVDLFLDSLFINPAVGSGIPESAYNGFFTQQVDLFSQAINVPFSLSAEGEVNDLEENVSIDEFRVDTDILDFSNIDDFVITGFKGSSYIAASSEIALGGTSSVQFARRSSLLPWMTWTNPGPPLDLSNIGADTVYLTVFLGEDAMPEDTGVPSYPGNLENIQVSFEDGDGNLAVHIFNKEDLTRGVNVLPILLDFPHQTNPRQPLNRADIVAIHFFPFATETSGEWDDVYFGRMHVLSEQAHFRPARAKIELDDIVNVYAQSLYGSELTFTNPDSEETVFTGDESYNDLDENAYIPKRYKVQLTAGEGTEGFDRPVTAENLRIELGRQGTFLKTQVVNDTDGEIYVDVFSTQFSTTGSRNTLRFDPDPSNPVVPDLISITGFQGGLEGQNTRLGAGSGNLAIAQQFEVTGGSATLRFAELFLHRLGSPEGSLTVTIHEDNRGEPGLLLAQAKDRFVSGITDGVPNYEIFHFDATVLAGAGAKYWIQISGDATYETSDDDENHVIWARSSAGSSLSSATADGTFSGGSVWAVNSGIHHFFKVIGDASP